MLVGAKRAEEVELAQLGPIDVSEVELAVRALPREEAAQPYLSTRADDQVRIRLAGRVQVRGDCLWGDPLRHRRRVQVLGDEPFDQRAGRVDELVAAAVAERDVQAQAVVLRGCLL